MLNEIDLSRVNLNLLTVFEAVLAEKSIGRAADRLALTPSAVSHSVARLRDLFGDPLFGRNPRGVTPTSLALTLAGPIAAILGEVRGVLASTRPFDSARSTRRFAIGAPDAVIAVILPPLLDILRAQAPGIGIRTQELLPVASDRTQGQAWRRAIADLDAGALDMAIIPSADIPVRFHAWTAYEDDFIIAGRSAWANGEALSMEAYCAAGHVLVSQGGAGEGFVDEVLAAHGRRREVAVTVPNFMLALALVADSDLVVAVPRSLFAKHGARFALAMREPPVELGRGALRVLSPKAAMADGGIAWLHGALARSLGRVSVSPPPP